MKRFLENIDLINKSESEEQKYSMIDDESEDKHKWSPLYFALENINLLLIGKET